MISSFLRISLAAALLSPGAPAAAGSQDWLRAIGCIDLVIQSGASAGEFTKFDAAFSAASEACEAPITAYTASLVERAARADADEGGITAERIEEIVLRRFRETLLEAYRTVKDAQGG